ncbi:stress-responsive transcriptional regulator, PspC family [Psychroflexus torquis ATCC 700755]|uniref:Stress-responsive transcriptional regulator, PspC family n=1 Tax=Psychroflexus torquis (strain ATCC 700755 / CIP 106069 / ACAM 623) TaxID=313595 RepID=K4ILT0_PSYTT|nr:PspC domain-containing protein [Psychroflexus torquis]AFU70016.1 stress-responsive transcriptional regulator, PspC family [Psychroflexus torquis ATCC 700755]
MNKTININLANVFFHIDEDAFKKLDSYLKAIERYLSKEQSKDEILQDIEARIAELFTESTAQVNQVITMSQVNAMIGIMGEPEAYMMEDDEEPSSSASPKFKASRKLYRDLERKYVGGVSAGLNHYLGINTLLIRLFWVISAFFSVGGTVAIYVIIWILIPAARTTAQKLDMQGEPVNLSNIERKVKEGYSKFADKVGDIDYEKYGQQTKSGLTKFLDGLGEVLRALGVFLSKFLGIVLLLISGPVLIGLLIFLFSFGTISVFELGDFSQIEIFVLGIPNWIQIVLFFLVAAIPFFYLLILSLKLIFSNLKSIGKAAHITLIGIWVLSVIVITTLSVKKQLDVSYDAEVIEVIDLDISSGDTLQIRMNPNLMFSEILNQSKKSKIVKDEFDNERLFNSNIHVNFKSTSDDELKLRLTKKSYASSKARAREGASFIDYKYNLEDNVLKLDSYLLSNPEPTERNAKVEVTIYIPENHVIYLDENLNNFNNRRNLDRSKYNHYLNYKNDDWECLDCITTADTLSTQN